MIKKDAATENIRNGKESGIHQESIMKRK